MWMKIIHIEMNQNVSYNMEINLLSTIYYIYSDILFGNVKIYKHVLSKHNCRFYTGEYKTFF